MNNRDGMEYLDMYPGLRKKWINQCIGCQEIGYKPDLPKVLYPATAAAANLRRYFNVLELNEFGLCNLCSRLLKL
jgi:hypothetical protein